MPPDEGDFDDSGLEINRGDEFPSLTNENQRLPDLDDEFGDDETDGSEDDDDFEDDDIFFDDDDFGGPDRTLETGVFFGRGNREQSEDLGEDEDDEESGAAGSLEDNNPFVSDEEFSRSADALFSDLDDEDRGIGPDRVKVSDFEIKKRIVRENAEIADTRGLREEFISGSGLRDLLEGVGMGDEVISALITANRSRNLASFKEFFAEIYEDPELKGRVGEVLDQITNVMQAGRSVSELRKREIFDQTFNNAEDPNDLIFLAILKDAELSKRWMAELDQKIKKESDVILESIDNGEAVDVDVLIVGGGPLTSLALGILGPFYKTMVVTNQPRLGEPWRSRPLYINSATEINNPGEEPLPLGDAGTTPITPFLSENLVQPGDLLSNETALEIICDFDTANAVGSIRRGPRRFLDGQKFGQGVATNIAYNADMVVVGNEVDPSKITPPDYDDYGRKTVVLEDGKGNERKVKPKAVLFLSGPGRETIKIADEATRKLYAAAELAVDDLVRNVEEAITRGVEVDSDFDIPRLLTLTSVEKLYRMWDIKFQRDPEYFPFKKLFDPNIRIAEIGGGDTTRVLNELFGFNGPVSAYPRDLLEAYKGGEELRPQRTLYNVDAKTIKEYRGTNRFRYRDTFDDRTEGLPQRVEYVDLTRDYVGVDEFFAVGSKPDGNAALKGNGVRVGDVAGDSRYFDYAFVSIGFERIPVEDKLEGADFTIRKVRDLDDNTVALGDSTEGVYLAGSATGFRAQDFPTQITNIIEGLGISENTVSLWVNAILVERLLWSLGANRRLEINPDKIFDVLDYLGTGGTNDFASLTGMSAT